MKKNHSKKTVAQELYIKSNYSYKMIAEALGVSESTVAKWSQAGKWIDLKSALIASPSHITALNNQEIVKIYESAQEEDRPLTSEEINDIHKLSKTNQFLAKEVDLSVQVEVLTAFNTWLKFVDATKANEMLKYIGEYLNEQVKK